MSLSEVKISNVRGVFSASIALNPRFNFILGPNGSGKTSILESLYLLSCGHSFRTREIIPVVSNGRDTMTVFGRCGDASSLSIQKSASTPTQIKINGQFCTTTSKLAYQLPCQVFYSDLFNIIDAGPSVRRSVLDWGLFHVKQDYLRLWKEYKHILKQRNALLKQRAAYKYFIPWDKQLSALAEQLNKYRSEYFSEWMDSFAKVLPELTSISCSVDYYKGWDKKNQQKLFIDVLSEQYETDIYKSFTQYGPHQADLVIESNDKKVRNFLSRGQQKIILIALKLAQTDLLEKPCLYLLDDYTAELDLNHQEKLIKSLENRKGQFVLTATNIPDLSEIISHNNRTLFEINNGVVEQCN